MERQGSKIDGTPDAVEIDGGGKEMWKEERERVRKLDQKTAVMHRPG